MQTPNIIDKHCAKLNPSFLMAVIPATIKIMETIKILNGITAKNKIVNAISIVPLEENAMANNKNTILDKSKTAFLNHLRSIAVKIINPSADNAKRHHNAICIDTPYIYWPR